MRLSFLGPSAVIAALALGACSATGAHDGLAAGVTSSDTSGAGGASGGDAAASSSSGGGGDATTITGLGGGVSADAGETTFSAYAHTNDTLFKIDPGKAGLGLTEIGTFGCIGSGGDASMTDLAVNGSGDLWGVSPTHAHRLALPAGGTGTVQCTLSIPIVSPSSGSFLGLTFAPVGVLDPSKEVLVASNSAGELWAIDTATGTLTQHGSFGTVPADDGHGHAYKYPGTRWELSGDIVFLANKGSPVGFATVRDCPKSSWPKSTNCNATDTLVELDLAALAVPGAQVVVSSVRGQVVKAAGCNDGAHTGYGSMFGIAAFQDKVFGFSRQSATVGAIVSIDNVDGTACLILPTPGDGWAGAAITTVAPVEPPTQT